METTNYSSFVLRLWCDEDEGPDHLVADWQSEIRHIQSGESWYFGTYEDLLSFLRSPGLAPTGASPPEG